MRLLCTRYCWARCSSAPPRRSAAAAAMSELSCGPCKITIAMIRRLEKQERILTVRRALGQRSEGELDHRMKHELVAAAARLARHRRSAVFLGADQAHHHRHGRRRAHAVDAEADEAIALGAEAVLDAERTF